MRNFVLVLLVFFGLASAMAGETVLTDFQQAAIREADQARSGAKAKVDAIDRQIAELQVARVSAQAELDAATAKLDSFFVQVASDKALGLGKGVGTGFVLIRNPDNTYKIVGANEQTKNDSVAFVKS